MSDTFAGIAPADVPGFILAEIVGALAATALFAWLWPEEMSARAVVVPHNQDNGGHNGMRRSVLFVCIHNSARSQMAEAFLDERCQNEFIAESAGLEPGKLNPLAVAAMAEEGIDISWKATKCAFDLYKAGRTYSYVITVCDDASAEQCPVFPGHARRLHWNFPDPAAVGGTWEERLAKTRLIRDQIRAQVDAWCDEVCKPLPAHA